MAGIKLSPETFLQVVVVISVFGLVLSLWLIWLVMWIFRRGQRSNELYFVYDRETFSSTVDAFLRLRQAPQTSP